MSVRSGIRKRVIATVAVCLTIGVAAHVWSGQDHGALKVPAVVRIGTASPGGAYAKLGEGLAALANEELGVTGFTAVQTDGSIENVDLLEAGKLEFALVQSDSPESSDVKTVAPLFDEILHIVVNVDKFKPLPKTIADLEGKALAIGPMKSGTRVAVQSLLDDYGVSFIDSFDVLKLPSTDGARRAFERGDVDAIFVVAGWPSETVKTLLDRGDTALLAVDDPESDQGRLEGYTGKRATEYKRAHLSIGDYGKHPKRNLETIAVKALLVARRDIPDALVHEVTRILYARNADLAHYHKSAEFIDLPTTMSVKTYAVHPGADLYHARKPVPFMARHGRSIGLAIAGLAYLLTLCVVLRERARLRRLALIRQQAAAGTGPGFKQHDVFIAYSSNSAASEAAVGEIREALDANGIVYWFAPKSIEAGTDWAEAIPDAIRHTRLALVLVFSESADDSEHCQREVSLASEAKLAIVPYFVEDTTPTGKIEYHTAHLHRIEAFAGPAETHLSALCAHLLKLRAELPPEPEAPDSVPPGEADDLARESTRRRRTAAVVACAAVLLLVIVFLWRPWQSAAPVVRPSLAVPGHRALQVGGIPTYKWTFAGHDVGVMYEIERWGAGRTPPTKQVGTLAWPESDTELVGPIQWRVRALVPGEGGQLEPTAWSETRTCTYYMDTLQKIRETGQVVVAVTEDSYNYEGADGNSTNLEIELIRLALQARLDQEVDGKTLEIVRRHIPWGSALFNSLVSPHNDLMASAITIKQEREYYWDILFTNPVVSYPQAFLHLVGQPVGAGKMGGADACRIGVKVNTTNFDLAKILDANPKTPGVRVVEFPGDGAYMDMFNALVLKRTCELLLLDEPFAVRIKEDGAKRNVALEVTPVDEKIMDNPPVEHIGIGVKKLDDNLRELLNAAIELHSEEIQRLKQSLKPRAALQE